MPVLLSLLAASAYGLADFVGGLGAKRASPWLVALMSQLGGAVSIAAFAAFAGGSPTSTDASWAVVAGCFEGLGTAFLYRGLASGRMGVVSPVSGVGSAVLPIVVGLAAGERPAALVWVGLAMALPAIWLVSRTPSDPQSGGPGRSGFVDGVLAGVGFGGMFAALAQIGPDAGYFPLVINQLVGGVVIVVVAGVLRIRWRPQTRGDLTVALAAGLLAGLLAGLSTGLFLTATHQGYLVVAAVLTSLYPAFTVLLAATVLREHIHRSQGVGLGLCLLSIAFVAGG
jgi:drug/metabolite transporter (DMT)-like permease